MQTGKEVWKFHTIPQPGEANFGTWEGDSWKTGGASVWVTGSYDTSSNTLYWGIGNPGPDWNPGVRPGSNLYTDSVVALDPDTGKLKWYFQFTPGDEWDFDSTQVPVLVDLNWKDDAEDHAVGQPRLTTFWTDRTASSSGEAVRQAT